MRTRRATRSSCLMTTCTSTPRPCTHQPLEADLDRDHPWSYDYICSNPERFTCLHDKNFVFQYKVSRRTVDDSYTYEVVKIGPHVHATEYTNMKVVHDAGLPVPRPIEFVPCPIRETQDTKLGSERYYNYILMEYIGEGEHIHDRSGTEARKDTMSMDIRKFIDEMQSLPVAAPDGSKPKYHFPIQYGTDNCAARLTLLDRYKRGPNERLHRIQDFMLLWGEHSDHRDLTNKFWWRLCELVKDTADVNGRLKDILREVMPQDAPAVVTHNFLHEGNILFEPETGEMVAVLDWSAAGVYPCYWEWDHLLFGVGSDIDWRDLALRLLIQNPGLPWRHLYAMGQLRKLVRFESPCDGDLTLQRIILRTDECLLAFRVSRNGRLRPSWVSKDINSLKHHSFIETPSDASEDADNSYNVSQNLSNRFPHTARQLMLTMPLVNPYDAANPDTQTALEEWISASFLLSLTDVIIHLYVPTLPEWKLEDIEGMRRTCLGPEPVLRLEDVTVGADG